MQGHLEELKRGGRPMTKTEIKLNNLNKGIDELLIKYEEELSKYSKLLKEANNNDILDAIAYQAICDFYIKVIQDLKKINKED